MAGFGTLAPGWEDEQALLDQQPQDDWRQREAQESLAAEQRANQPSGLSTLWSAIKHPSLYPMYKALTTEQEAPKPSVDTSSLPDVGPPLISPGPQISGGTRIGRALSENVPQAVFGAIGSGATAPGEALAGRIPMYDPEGRTSPEMISRGVDLSALAGGASVAGTAERAAARAPGADVRLFGKQLFSDTGKPAAVAAIAEHAPPFTTSAESALERIPAKSATGAQWVNQLKRYGTKPEEMDWRGLTEELQKRQNQAIPREEIEQHLANSGVDLTPIVKGTTEWEDLPPRLQAHVHDMMEDRYRNDPYGEMGSETARDYYERMRDEGYLPEEFAASQPEFQQYTLPGAENYRERLMQVPQRDPASYGVFSHSGERLHPDKEWDTAGEAQSWANDAKYPNAMEDAQIPMDAQVKQLTGHYYQGPHWKEPNVVFHRRSSDRMFEEAPTQEQLDNRDAIEHALRAKNGAQAQINQTVREINRIRQGKDAVRRDQIFAQMRGDVITPAEAQRRLQEMPDIPELSPLQDKLQQLRDHHDSIMRDIAHYESNQPKQIRSLHDEENQSDWHQQGREKGYGDPNAVRDRGEANIEHIPSMFPGQGPGTWRVSWPEGGFSGGYHTREAAQHAADTRRYEKAGFVPDAPFKGTGWERLAAHDQLREAAEKGYPRISWTAGEENPTNPVVMARNQGRVLEDELSGPQLEEARRADKGIRDYYNRRRVDQVNKIGKPHGVQVQRGELPTEGGKSVPAYYMDIPDSLRKELLTKPASLFSDTGEAAKAAAIAGHLPQGGAREAFENFVEGIGRHGTGETPAAAAEAGVAQPAAAVGGGDAGGTARLGAAQAQAERAAGPHSPLPGLPTNPLKVGNDLYIPGPIAKIKDVADAYMRDKILPSYHVPPLEYRPLDPEHSKAIAKAYEEMKHAPDDPAVKNSYDAMIRETRDQYDAIRKNHPELQLVPNKPGEDPYAATPRLAAKDVIENNRLHFFPTEHGFGTTGQEGIDMAKHPMMQPSGRTLNGQPLLNNDLFRIVHDYFGHLKEGYGFRAAGEDNAWRSHASMYSDLARPAMTTETRGQNSWVNYGPHGEANRTASAGDTVYAPQKVGLMPEWTMRDRGSPEPLITYRGGPHGHSMVDMSKIGTGEGSGVRGEGMYSAEAPPIATFYRHFTATTQDPLLKKYGLGKFEADGLGRDLGMTGGDPKPIVEAMNDHIENLKAKVAEGDTTAATKNQITTAENMVRYLNDPKRATGHMYQLALDRPEEQYLHWDKPYGQQSQYVKDRLQPMLDYLTPKMEKERLADLAKAKQQLAKNPEGIMNQVAIGNLRRAQQPIEWHNVPGERLYEKAAEHALGREAKSKTESYPVAAQYLRTKGIAGIKYDAGKNFGLPPGVPKGAQNYVSFNPERILKRYAIPGMLGGGAALPAFMGRDDNGS